MSAFSSLPASRSVPVRLPLLGAAGASMALADVTRPADRVRPIYAVWEVTRRCDLACRHRGTRAGHARSDELDTESAWT